MSSKSLPYAPVKELTEEFRAVSWPSIVLALLLILFVALRFWHISSYSLWGGEAFTVIGVQKSWDDMFAYILADIVHPPLFYILLKLWIMIGGESLLWLKLFPGFSGVAVVAPFVLLGRELNMRLPALNLALLLVAVNGYLVHYAQELRMYSLFMFLAVSSFWLFIRWFKSEETERGQLLLLTVVNLLALYTHYYGWVVVGTEFLFLLIWRRQKVIAFGFSMFFLLLCFAPWAYLVVREVLSIGGLEQNLDWIPKPGVRNILDLYVTFNGPLGNRYVKLFGLALFGLPLLLWGWQLVRAGFGQRRDEWLRFSWLALLAFVPVLALFVVSQFMDQAVWMDRYFIFIAIPYMMLVATAVYHLKPYWLRNGWIMAIVLWTLFAGLNDLKTNRMAWESPQVGSRVGWDGLVRQMVAAEAETSGQVEIYTLTVISKGLRTGDWALSTSIDYFLDRQGVTKFQTVYTKDVYTLLETADKDHYWVAYFELREWPQRSPTAVLANNGYRVGDKIVFQNQNNRVVLAPVWRR
jgi:4-amino-4-deoxy-L-arabinose transferase-like glycosyltransferase